MLIAGLAGLVAGAMSMAAGEYVSVSSQTNAERADLARETRELAETPEAELEELTGIHVDQRLDRNLAEKVATQLTERDALGSHARDELGISETVTARPVQAALVSALTFAVGAVVPLVVVLLAPEASITLFVAASTILGLAVLGGLGASAGGAGVVRGAVWRHGGVANIGSRGGEGSMSGPSAPPRALAKALSRSGCGRIFALFSKVMAGGLSTGSGVRRLSSGLSGPKFSKADDCADLVNSCITL